MDEDSFDQDVPDLTGAVSITESRPIFSGPYSTIYKGLWKFRDRRNLNQEQVVIKIPRIISNSTNTMRRKVRRETYTWWILKHPNVVPFYGTAQGDLFGSFGGMVSPWYKNGNAAQYLSNNEIVLQERLRLWHGVSLGLQYLHNHSPCIIHADIKPNNVLIDDAGNPQLCDFGLVRFEEAMQRTTLTTTSEHVGTALYLAHELVATQPAIPTKYSDVHALGCIGLEFVFNLRPHAEANGNIALVYNCIFNRKLPADRPLDIDGIHSEIWKLVEGCWNLDPLGRPSTAAIAELLNVYRMLDRNNWSTQKLAAETPHLPNKDAFPAPTPNKPSQSNDNILYLELLLGAAETAEMEGLHSVAEFLLNEVLEHTGTLQEPLHTQTLSIMTRLVTAYDSSDYKGNLTQFIELCNRLDVTVGPENVNAQQASQKLEQVFLITSDSEREHVEPLLFKTFQARVELLGPIDPSTVIAERRLRSLYDALKTPEKMEACWELAYFSKAERLGESHPDSIQTSLKLEAIYRESDSLDKLLLLYERRLTYAIKSLRDNPREVAEIERKLKMTYFRLGRHSGLLGLLERLFQTRVKVLGSMHVDTVRTLHEIKTLEILPEKREKVRRAKTNSGYRSPSVMKLLEELAEIYESVQYYDELEATLQEVISGRCDVLGPAHPQTLAVMEKLATAYEEQGKFDQQEAMNRKIAAKLKASKSEDSWKLSSLQHSTRP